MTYRNLHCHSTFSILDGFGSPERIVERVVELGQDSVALTEHGNISSHPQLEKAAQKHGIKPIYGCEFYFTDGEEKQRKKNHLTVLAKNMEGYKNLLKLVNRSYEEQNFYYTPTIYRKDLEQFSGGLIVMTGCLYGVPAQKVLNDDIEGCLEFLKWLEGVVGYDNMFIEIQPLDLAESREVNSKLKALRTKYNFVYTTDAHLIRKEDANKQWFITCIRKKTDINNSWGALDDRCRYADTENIYDWDILGLDDAIHNSGKIAERIEHFKLPKADISSFSTPDSGEKLLNECRKGWIERFGAGFKDERYVNRVLKELDILERKGFNDYFLIVADIVMWAKEQGIMVGLARGSAAGSLVSYLLGITEVDPIRWNLLFERFIDESRKDYPDIDIDFQDDRRGEIQEYLAEKYGSDKVCNIAAYSQLKERSLLDDAQRVLKVSTKQAKEDVDKGMELPTVIKRHLPEHEYLCDCLGLMRQFTKHAAGVVVSSKPIDEFTAVGREGLMLDYKDAEYLGLLKIDVLGLKTLTIFKHCLEAIGKDADYLWNVPIDDERVIQEFSTNNFAGIFQFEGATTRALCQRVKPTSIEQLIHINAISRPAVLNTGASEQYIHNTGGAGSKLLPEITKDTRGQLLFQEQTMRALREEGQLDWADVNKFRKLMAKKGDPEELKPIKKRFLENGGSEAVWNMCGESCSYGFNRSHAVSYTLLSYFSMYLKVYYPLEFYWANLKVNPDNKEILREFIHSKGAGKVLGVKLGKSKSDWTIDYNVGGIRAGFLTIKGIGQKTAEKLEAGQEPKGKVKQLLEEAGAFEDDETDVLGQDKLLEAISGVSGRSSISTVDGLGWIAGEVLSENIRTTPEGEAYLTFKLSDETDTVECVVSKYKYPKLEKEDREAVKEGNYVKVFGDFNKRSRKFYATKVKGLKCEK